MIEDRLLEEILNGRRSVLELSDENCRKVLLLLVKKVKKAK